MFRVQVPNNQKLTQNLYYDYYYPKTKYLIIAYLDPLDQSLRAQGPGRIHDQGSVALRVQLVRSCLGMVSGLGFRASSF